MDGTHHTITISFEPDSDETRWQYVARVAAYPDVECYGRYPGEAYWLAADAAEGLDEMNTPDSSPFTS
jgi:hypothetical protein